MQLALFLHLGLDALLLSLKLLLFFFQLERVLLFQLPKQLVHLLVFASGRQLLDLFFQLAHLLLVLPVDFLLILQQLLVNQFLLNLLELLQLLVLLDPNLLNPQLFLVHTGGLRLRAARTDLCLDPLSRFLKLCAVLVFQLGFLLLDLHFHD